MYKLYVLPRRILPRPGFWRGFISAFNLFPKIRYHSTGHSGLDETLALAGDWIMVGRDLSNALDEARLDGAPSRAIDESGNDHEEEQRIERSAAGVITASAE
jgi:hypothetical protein